MLVSAPFALAAGDDPPASAGAPKDPVIEKVEAAVGRKDWQAAAGVLRVAVAANPQNAEYHNRYGFVLRKGPAPDMAQVFHHYQEALRLEPKHRGAHEYIGEAYLMVGDLAKAKAHLGELDSICFFGCDEFDMLKMAIVAYEKRTGTKQAK
ncbi:MAG: tetratricopeptide repeat protein [Proteobacteria bacterium]|nr:tetratricopeptide repeat protein [Pseudomonadota bacterium]